MPSADAAPTTDAGDDAYRLPRTVSPSHYRLTLVPDLDNARFEGSVEIALEAHEAVKEIVCNAIELEIAQATIETGAGRLSAQVAYDEASERVTFVLPETLAPGSATLRCSFSGILNDQLRGFYRSTFKDAEGNTQTIATSQLEATDARRAFPCWDEPDRKATYAVTLVVPRDLQAFSNSAVVAEEIEGDKKRVVFVPTMKMSTYLLAFIVGPLEATEPVHEDGVPLRVVYQPGKAHLSQYALEVGAHALRFYTEYFAIPYPGDKLDLVAIPDFAFGAMENLGCVTFRETALIDPASASRAECERVADVICHEIAHMWFGDLVTMGWWEGIWLNEAFATFMEVKGVDAFRPTWDRWVSFEVERETAMAVDDLHSTRPIEYTVVSPDDANGMFDVLTYEKGGSVLRMLEQYLGENVFRNGVRRYLTRHAYANTVTADLWDALEEESGEPVRAMMDSWILQGGHPLVHVENGVLSQTPFSYGPAPAGTTSSIGGPWQVPVQLRPLHEPIEAATLSRLLLSGDDVRIAPLGTAERPVVVNALGWGVYRTAYAPELLDELAGSLAKLAPLEHAMLFADTWAAVLAGRVSLASFFSLAGRLERAEEPTTWGFVAGALDLSTRVLGLGNATVAAATKALLAAWRATLGWAPVPGEHERTPTLRALLIRTLGRLGGDEAVIAEAVRRYDADRTGAEALDANVAAAVLAVVANQTRPGDFDNFLARYREPHSPQDELRHLTALGAFPDVELSLRAFELALDEIRTQDAPYFIAVLLGNEVAGPAVWDEVKKHWDTLLGKFPHNSHARMVATVRGLCADAAVAQDVTGFLTEHPIETGQRSVIQTLERLAINVAFCNRERAGLEALLGRVASIT